MNAENKNLNAFGEILSSVFNKESQSQTQNMRTRILNEAINSIDTPRKLNTLIDTLEQADLKALLKGDTITVFRKFQLKRIEDYCASIHFPIHVQPCVDKSLGNAVWAYNISKSYPKNDKEREAEDIQRGRYHY